MWGRPFFVKLKDASKVAVFVIDTQETFDQYTTKNEVSSLIGLSLLSSSCLIFNSMNNLQEDMLNSLEIFVKYGLLVTGNKFDTPEQCNTAFQNLMFLIRDWNFPNKFPYGCEGGRQFLSDALSIKPTQTDEVQAIRVMLKKVFAVRDCGLLPDLGSKSKSADFVGMISQLSEEFLTNVESIITTWFQADLLPIKRVTGHIITGIELFAYIKEYVQLLNTEETFKPCTVMEVTAKVFNQNIVEKLSAIYNNKVSNFLRQTNFTSCSELLKYHTKTSSETLNEFQNAKKIGNINMFASYEDDLRYSIKTEFETFDKQNTHNIKTLIANAESSAIVAFTSSLKDYVENESFLVEEEIVYKLECAKKNSLTSFSNMFMNNDSEELQEALQVLSTKLTAQETDLKKMNKTRKNDAEKRLEVAIKCISSDYLTAFMELLKHPIVFSENTMQKHNETLRLRAFEKLKAFQTSVPVSFLSHYEKVLAENLVLQFSIAQKVYKCKIQECLVETQNLKKEMVVEFERNLKTSFKLDHVKKINFDKIYQRHESERVKIFNKEQLFACDTSGFISNIVELKDELRNKFYKLESDHKKEIEKCISNYQNALDVGFSSFQITSLSVFEATPFLSDQEFKDMTNDSTNDAKCNFHKTVTLECGKFHTEYLKYLDDKILNDLLKLTKLNAERKESFCFKANATVEEASKLYQNNMLEFVSSVTDETLLKRQHLKEKKNYIRYLFSENQNFNKKDFFEDYRNKLSLEIDRMFVEEIQFFFSIKCSERKEILKRVREMAKQSYSNEMNKHVKNHEFMPPAHLYDLHVLSTQIALQECTKNSTADVTEKDIKPLLKIMYRQYIQNNNMNAPTDPAIGIDLGTTHCCVAVYHKGNVKIVPNGAGKNTTPSYVCYGDNKEQLEDSEGNVTVGETAKQESYVHAENTIHDVKRIIGRQFNDISQNDLESWNFKVENKNKIPKISVQKQFYHPEEVSAEVLKYSKATAEDFLRCPIKNAVITVPAYFTDGQRQATIDAGKLAGLNVLNVLTEPVAAAMTYKLQNPDEDARHVLVYDLGGGTFDVAVLSLSKGLLRTVQVDGDTHLGGGDFDKNIIEYCIEQFKEQTKIDLNEGLHSDDEKKKQEVRDQKQRLKLACEKSKEVLSFGRSTQIMVNILQNNHSHCLNVKLTRQKFEEINKALMSKTLHIVERCLKSAKIDKSEIQDVILVGGSTRIPKIKAMLTEFFNEKALNQSVHPDEAVAYGAAVQAAILHGKASQKFLDFKVQDVTPMSLGIKIIGGGHSVIIPKGTIFPVQNTLPYFTTRSNQTSVSIQVYQGEDPVAVNNHFLGEFVLNQIPSAPRGKEVLPVTMNINSEGVLHVTAKCESNGVQNSIFVVEHKHRLGVEVIKKLQEKKHKKHRKNTERNSGRRFSTIQKNGIFKFLPT